MGAAQHPAWSCPQTPAADEAVCERAVPKPHVTEGKNSSQRKLGQRRPDREGGKKLLRLELLSPPQGPGEGTS